MLVFMKDLFNSKKKDRKEMEGKGEGGGEEKGRGREGKGKPLRTQAQTPRRNSFSLWATRLQPHV